MNKSNFIWDDKYLIGHKTIDAQHKALFKLGARLEATIQGKERYANVEEFKEELSVILKDLGQYTFFHFSTEEKVMQQVRFPFLEEHKKEHLRLLASLTSINNSLPTLNEKELSTTLIQLVSSWLTDHIIQNDYKVRDFIKIKDKIG